MKCKFGHISVFPVVGLLLSICGLLCFGYGLYATYLSMMPTEQTIRYADLDALPRGLTSIDKLIKDRLPKDSIPVKSIVAYNYQKHTLYDIVRGDDSLTIPAHITDTLPPVFQAPVPDVTAWSDSLLYGTLALEKYQLDYRRIIARYDGQVSRIEWNSFDTIPIYIISLEGHDEPIYISAVTPYVKPFYLAEEQVSSAIKRFCSTDSVSTELMKKYDDYYVDLDNSLTLPVWKTTAGDYTYYTNPRTGSYISYQTSSIWIFLKCHAFNALRYKLFAKHPERWPIVIWSVLIAGALLSLIGIILCIRKIRNKNQIVYEEII